MKTLVIYDSAYGNTERIARSIGGAMPGEVKVLRAGEFDPAAWEPVDILFVGSPVQSGKPTKAIQGFLNSIPESALKETSAAAFDTRYSMKWVGIFGSAAAKIAEGLEARGATLAASPEAFFVKGKEGPLKEGELERAALWAKEAAGRLMVHA